MQCKNAEDRLVSVFLNQNQSFEHENSLPLCLINCGFVHIGFIVIWLCFVVSMHYSILLYFWSEICDYIHKSIVQLNNGCDSHATLHNNTLGYLTPCSFVETSKQLVSIQKSNINAAVLFLCCFGVLACEAHSQMHWNEERIYDVVRHFSILWHQKECSYYSVWCH